MQITAAIITLRYDQSSRMKYQRIKQEITEGYFSWKVSKSMLNKHVKSDDFIAYVYEQLITILGEQLVKNERKNRKNLFAVLRPMIQCPRADQKTLESSVLKDIDVEYNSNNRVLDINIQCDLHTVKYAYYKLAVVNFYKKLKLVEIGLI